MNVEFKRLLERELQRLEDLGVCKRSERVIGAFTKDACPRAIIGGREVLLFNSNDYMGMRFNPLVHAAEEKGLQEYGSGAGAVRFISGSLKIHHELEQTLARFHGREAAMIFSSAFSTNVSIIQALCRGAGADSLVTDNLLIISDELNHRSIIDGVRITGLPSQQKVVFHHNDYQDLERLLHEKAGTCKRVIVISDGIFSMLGEAQDVKKIRDLCDRYSNLFEQGILFILDDSHGVGCFGETGRGCEEYYGAHCDLLVGTLGKAFGVEGGYVVGDAIVLDYLRETAASYIYSNPISPASACAAHASVNYIDSPEGKKSLGRLRENIEYFKSEMKRKGFVFAADSVHPIQPLLIGDTLKTRDFAKGLLERGILVTPINYPVVPKGKDEVRVQLSALHGKGEITTFVNEAGTCAREIGLVKDLQNGL